MRERAKRITKTMMVMFMCITMCIPQVVVYAAEVSKINEDAVRIKTSQAFNARGKVKVKAPTLKDLSAKEGKLTIKLKKVKGARGYQIKYATNEKFKKAKIKDIPSSGKLTFEVTPSEYYITFRSYVKANGRRYYSSWVDANDPWFRIVAKTYTIDMGKGKTKKVLGYFLVEEAEEIVKLTNAYRKRKGLSTLKRRNDLMNTASIRASEQSVKFAHQRPNGTDRATAFPKGMKRVGENLRISGGYRYTAKDMVNNWINSPVHNVNMLNSQWNCMGAAVFVEAKKEKKWNLYYSEAKMYSVQSFGRK